MSSKAMNRFFRLLKKHGFTATGKRRFKVTYDGGGDWVIRSGCHCPLTLVASKEGPSPHCYDYFRAAYYLGINEDERNAIVEAADGFSGPLRTCLLKTLDLKEPT